VANRNDFTIIKTIGKGAFGSVFLVEHNLLGSCHAMKVLSKERVLTTNAVEGVMGK